MWHLFIILLLFAAFNSMSILLLKLLLGLRICSKLSGGSSPRTTLGAALRGPSSLSQLTGLVRRRSASPNSLFSPRHALHSARAPRPPKYKYLGGGGAVTIVTTLCTYVFARVLVCTVFVWSEFGLVPFTFIDV